MPARNVRGTSAPDVGGGWRRRWTGVRPAGGQPWREDRGPDTVGEYDILILSALQSGGLETWLKENGYRIPAGASSVLGSYIRQNMKFFVARVNLQEQSKLGFSMLRPIQVALCGRSGDCAYVGAVRRAESFPTPPVIADLAINPRYVLVRKNPSRDPVKARRGRHHLGAARGRRRKELRPLPAESADRKRARVVRRVPRDDRLAREPRRLLSECAGADVAGVGAVIVLGRSRGSFFERYRDIHIWPSVGFGTYHVAAGHRIIQAGLQARADRFLYLPHIGLSLAVAWGVSDSCGAAGPVALPAVAGRHHHRARADRACLRETWQDAETMWRRALAVTTDNYMAHHNLGVTLAAKGQDDRARAELQEALRIWPEFAEAHNSMGNLEARAQDDESAIVHYTGSPPAGAVLCRGAQQPGTGALAQRGDSRRAGALRAGSRAGAGTPPLRITTAAARCSPRAASPRPNQQYREAIRLRPRYAEARYSLGELLAASGQTDEAAAQFREVIRLAPGHTPARAALGRLSGTRY